MPVYSRLVFFSLCLVAFNAAAEDPAYPPRRAPVHATESPCVVAFLEPATAALYVDNVNETAVDSRFDSQFYGPQFFDETEPDFGQREGEPLY